MITLRNGRAAGVTGMKAEHLKEWLLGIRCEKAEDGVEGVGGPLSSLMFNVCVNAVVREWLQQCLGDDAAWIGIGMLYMTMWLRFLSTMGWSQQGVRNGCSLHSQFLLTFSTTLASRRMRLRRKS